jgi:hypothetical protein
VSDHALSLARELEFAFDIGSAFVVLNSTEPCDAPFPRLYCPQAQLLDACVSLTNGQPGSLLVHSSGYGYSTDGAPFVLAEALAEVRSSGGFRIGVYFHELFARGMPWESAFWYTRRQQQAVRDIAKSCDLIATNMDHHARWLNREVMPGVANPLQRLPVFSNVGEALGLPSMSPRRPAMAVFGLPGTRQSSYRRLSRLGTMLKSLGVEEILDIGPEFDAPRSLNGIQVARMGVMDAADIAVLLTKSMFGFVPHPAFCLAKSGIFAGLCAFGTIPVLPVSFAGEPDGLTDGVHLLSPRTARDASAGKLEQCSTAAWNWYMGHRLHVHAATYAQMLVQQPIAAATKAGVSVQAAAV